MYIHCGNLICKWACKERNKSLFLVHWIKGFIAPAQLGGRQTKERQLLLHWAAVNTSASLCFHFLTMSSLCAHPWIQEIVNSCFDHCVTPANSCKADVWHAGILGKPSAAEVHSTGKSWDRQSQNRKDWRSTADKLDRRGVWVVVIIDGYVRQWSPFGYRTPTGWKTSNW